MEKVCIIGAGSSGLTACQVLAARGIPFDCFEKGSMIGGNWRYENDNGMSSAYRSLHINSARKLMSLKAFPMPADYPDYPSHWQVAKYFDDFAERFGLAEKITFRTEVVAAEPDGDDWSVTVENPDGARRTERYRAVLVANGHHWKPRWPEPAFPGADAYEGEQMHVHHYREPDVLVGKRVLVLGIGNSAVDVAVESSRIAEATFLAMRRGAYVLPKFLGGKPIDESATPALSRLPIPVQRFFFNRLLKPSIDRFTGGRTVRFADGSEEQIDLVVYCTGYEISFPFLDEKVFAAPDNRMPLYQRAVSVENPGLYFVAFIQPLGPLMPIAEAQSEWIADLLTAKAALPPAPEMRKEIAGYERWLKKRFVASKRHTVEVDFHPYLREIARERGRSAQPA